MSESHRIEQLEAEIERLRADLQQTWSLSLEWQKKHDKLLGFIQKRPAVLKELIEHDAVEQEPRD